MLRADELYNEVTQDVASKGASQGMFIGCFIDTATGWITFTCEGKETKHRYKVFITYQCFLNCKLLLLLLLLLL